MLCNIATIAWYGGYFAANLDQFKTRRKVWVSKCKLKDKCRVSTKMTRRFPTIVLVSCWHSLQCSSLEPREKDEGKYRSKHLGQTVCQLWHRFCSQSQLVNVVIREETALMGVADVEHNSSDWFRCPTDWMANRKRTCMVMVSDLQKDKILAGKLATTAGQWHITNSFMPAKRTGLLSGKSDCGGSTIQCFNARYKSLYITSRVKGESLFHRNWSNMVKFASLTSDFSTLRWCSRNSKFGCKSNEIVEQCPTYTGCTTNSYSYRCDCG